MMNVYLILDESGVKGYSDKAESLPGEFGAMAAYLVPQSSLSSVQAALDPIRDLFSTTGKLHITDLQPKDQENLRSNILTCFVEKQIPWVYEAIYAQGFFEDAKLRNSLTKAAYDARRSKVKISYSAAKDSLWVELFQGIFAKAIAFCLDHVGKRFHLEIISDKIDESIIKKFKKAADEFLHLSQESIREVTGFDKSSEKLVKGSITTKISAPSSLLDDPSGVTYSIRCEDSSLTLAADVLVNSLQHHLKAYLSQDIGKPLNAAGAISGFELASLVYGSSESTGSIDFSDALFAYPSKNSDNE